MRKSVSILLTLLLLFFLLNQEASAESNFQEARNRMVKEQIEQRGITELLLLSALRTVPRHEFVPENIRHLAYEDTPLPIGYGQTISQPYMDLECLRWAPALDTRQPFSVPWGVKCTA